MRNLPTYLAALLLGLDRAARHVGLEGGGEPLLLALPDGARLVGCV